MSRSFFHAMLAGGIPLLDFDSAPVLAAISLTDTTSDLEWTSVINATEYEVQRDTNSSFTSPTTIYSGASTTYQDSGSLSDHFYYRVRAKATGYNNSDWSNTYDVTLGSDTLFWFRGDTLTTSGLELTQWTDKTGNAHHATPVAARNTPQLLASQLNSNDVVDFISTNSEILELAAISGITTYTATIVFKADSVTGVRSLLSQIQNAAGGFLLQGFNSFISTNTIQTSNRDGSGTQLNNFAFTDTASYHIFVAKFSSVGSGTSLHIAKLDGPTKLNLTNLNPISANNNKLYVGALLGAGADDLDGKIAEIVFSTKYLSDSQQKVLFNKINTYYNLGLTYYNDGLTGAGVLADISYPSTIDSIPNLYGRVSYNSVQDQPILIIMHGYAQQASDFLDGTLERFKNYGFFVAALGMRGRDAADGSKDDSGRELYDIYDGVQYIKTTFSSFVNTSRVILLGYSGGGGNILGMASRFPDLAVLYIDFFGISDYGYDGTFSYYAQTPSQRASLEANVGGTPAAKPNEYKSRQFMWSASNCKGKLRIYHDLSDTAVQVNHSTRLVTQLTSDGFSNYVYSQSQSGDPERWIHGLPNVGQTGEENIDAEVQFVDEGLSTLPLPSMPNSGTLKINGFLKCELFSIWLGAEALGAQDGKNRRATLVYNHSSNTYTVTPSIDSPETTIRVCITVLSGDHAGKKICSTISSSTGLTPITPDVGFSSWTNLDAISSKRFNGLFPILRGDSKYDFFAATVEGDLYYGEQGVDIDSWTWTQVVTGMNEIQTCKAFYYNSKWHVLLGHKVGGTISLHIPQGSLSGAYDSYTIKTNVTEIQDIKIQAIDSSGLPQFSFSFQGNVNGNGGVYWMKFTGSNITSSADWTTYEIKQHNAAWWHSEIFTLGGNNYIAFSARTNGANPSEVPGAYLLQLNDADRTQVATESTLNNTDADWLHVRLGNFFGNGVYTDIAIETLADGKIHLFDSSNAWAETEINLNPTKNIENIINIGDPFSTGRDSIVAVYISDFGRVTYFNGTTWTHTGGTMAATSTHPYDNEGYLLDLDNSGTVRLIVDNNEISPIYGHIQRSTFGKPLTAKSYV